MSVEGHWSRLGTGGTMNKKKSDQLYGIPLNIDHDILIAIATFVNADVQVELERDAYGGNGMVTPGS